MKVLFLGLGGVGQRHLRNLLKLFPDAEIGAVRHLNRAFEISSTMQADYTVNIDKKYGIKLFHNIEEASAWKPNFAIVSSPTSAHVEQTKALVLKRIPVLLEKPISHSEEGLKELNTLIKEYNVPVMIAYMLRFHPGVQKLLRLVKDKVLGKLFSAQFQLSSFMPSWHNYEKYNEFYAGKKELGGGAILSEIHEIDLMHEMFGSPKRVWTVGGKLSNYDLDVEDTVSALFEYDNGNSIFPVTINMSFVQRPLRRAIDIYGEKGRISWDLMTGELVVKDMESEKSEVFKTENFERNDMFLQELKHFIDSINTGKNPIASFDKVLNGHIIALKMKESLIKNEIVYFT